MRLPLIQLQESLSGATVFVIGGGSSLRGFDYNRLQGHKTVGINQACVYVPDLTAIYWADADWAAKNDDTLSRHACKLRFCGRYGSFPDNALLEGGAIPLKITGEYGFDPDINNVRGNNSGCHVLNLCVNAGAKRIVLLGFDMQMKHWHDDYSLPYTPSVYEGFLESIESMAPHLRDVEVINCSLNSAITTFPKVPIDDILGT
jgi:hypothetical protein